MITDLFGEVPIVRGASLSRCGDYRFTLTRSWGGGDRVCFIGLNPSTADDKEDDPTVRRWIHFTRSWGFNGFVAVNLYPFRSSSPAECRRWSDWDSRGPDWYARDRLQENLGVITSEAKAAALVVACWGAGAWDPDWVDHVVEEVMSGAEPWPDLHCFATSKDGSPVHPMARGKHRVPDDAVARIWKSQHGR